MTLTVKPVEDLPLEEWWGQYLLSEDPLDLPAWKATTVGGRYLHTHPDLPVTDVIAGGARGKLLGWPVGDGFVRRLELADRAALHARLDSLCGRWLYIGADEVIGDAVQSLPCVYSRETRRVASSTGLLGGRVDEDLLSVIDPSKEDLYFAFGLFPLHDAGRLLPNHHLSLTSFGAKRRYGFPAEAMPLSDVAARAIEIARRTVKPFINAMHTKCGLTGGYDSRTLLACFRPYADDIDFFTNSFDPASLDVRLARKLARHASVKHRFGLTQIASAADQKAWVAKTGHAVGGNVLKTATRELQSPLAVNFPGMIGEHARLLFYRPGDEHEGGLDPADAVDRLGFPQHPRVIAAAEETLAGLGTDRRLEQLSLLYVEQRTGAWAAPQTLGGATRGTSIFAWNERKLSDAMISLPLAEKLSGAFPKEVMRQAWPELLNVPVNREWGVRRIPYLTRYYGERLKRIITA